MTESKPSSIRAIRDRILILILKILIRLVRALTALVQWLNRYNRDRVASTQNDNYARYLSEKFERWSARYKILLEKRKPPPPES